MTQPLLLIRADAGPQIGTGHVMRCLALAQAWQDAGGHAVFATAQEIPAIERRLRSEGFGVERIAAESGSARDAELTAELAAPADWIVLDGYCFREEYQRAVKNSGQKVLLIDDYGQVGRYCADLVVDQNCNTRQEFYRDREPQTELLLGAEYGLLRREFHAWREWNREFPAAARKVLVTLGGADPGNVTPRIIAALRRLAIAGLESTVLLGAANPYRTEIEQAVRGSESIRLAYNVANVPWEMASADIAIIAAGGTLWELLFMGCAVLSYSRNQIHAGVLADLAERGAVNYVGDVDDIDEERLAEQITHVASHRACRERMSKNSRAVVDGMGAQRVLAAMGLEASHAEVRMVTVSAGEREEFMRMARKHFSELNPDFTPHADWNGRYFENIQTNSNYFLRWMMKGNERAGFILFGIEKHRFLPRETGMIYEVYVAPEHRRNGIARICAAQAITELRAFCPSKIQLETVDGNEKANALWRSMGFQGVSERFVLQDGGK